MVLFFFISFIYIFLYNYNFHTFIYYFYSFLCIINIKVYKTYNHQILILSIISLKHFCHIPTISIGHINAFGQRCE